MNGVNADDVAALPLRPGARVRFTTPYGLDAGTYEGEIIARMVPNQFGFAPNGAPHYEVRTYCGHDGRNRNFAVEPQMIEEGSA